ncbi:helix-turn-helix transcriptional regulator [Herbaspirillum sp.]|uniref:helix-turn-helix transcriptional regulator n=1 Tax=Herbaspirillum sp. TaxID=1890675 RepID=UPI0031D3EC6A
MGSEDFAQLVGELYDGVTDPQGWAKVLCRLAAYADSDAASIMLWRREDSMALIGEYAGLPDQLLIDYREHYDKEDPGRYFGDKVKRGEWYLDERELGLPFIRKSSFYQDFLKRYELDSTMVTPMLKGVHIDGFLSLSARAGKRDQAAVVRRLAPLLPHLERASALRVRLLGVAQQQELSALVLDRINFPLLVVTYDKKVLLANALGQQWLALPGNPMSASSPFSSHFTGLLKTATGLNGTRRAAGFIMPLADGSRQFVNAVPLSLPVDGWGDIMPQALVWIHSSDGENRSCDDILKQLFHLTPGEIRVLQQLMNGGSVKEISAVLEISESTTRTHLKAIFSKMNVSRQAELQRLLNRLNVVI